MHGPRELPFIYSNHPPFQGKKTFRGSHSPPTMAEKIIRDPVHDVIAFRLDRPADALLFRLINASEFQRLRRIRQLGMASLAYPGADHSRYSHSLGVMQTARLMLGQLRHSVSIDDGEE